MFDDPLLLARAQFGLNIAFHILFPSITIALAWFLVYLRVRANRAGAPSTGTVRGAPSLGAATRMWCTPKWSTTACRTAACRVAAGLVDGGGVVPTLVTRLLLIAAINRGSRAPEIPPSGAQLFPGHPMARRRPTGGPSPCRVGHVRT